MNFDDSPPPPRPVVRYRVTAPGPVSGGVMGVGFANGLAVVEETSQHVRALAWFRAELGYRVELLDPPASDAAPEQGAPEPAPADNETAEDSASAATTRRRK